ncbi:MAG: DNA-formamidopyrimidine glycosylase family protein [Gemmatimonadaceae bacterium]
MPELPDITVYIEALESRLIGQRLERTRIAKPFLLRSVDPPIGEAAGKLVTGMRRMGKRIVMEMEDDLFLVIHLMIAGRLRWLPTGAKVPGKIGLAAFDFPTGNLILTEAGSKRRASLWLVRGEPALEQFERGGLEVFESTLADFSERLTRENHTLKRSLTDPRLFSGIGKAYSDEILHRAKLSPVKHSRRLNDEETARLFAATRDILTEWTDRLRNESKGEFPTKVTAFREEMAVHGKFGKPCPVCGTPVQRIRYADNETNYCPRCQTDGKLLADRALSRLLKQDWPRSIDDLTWS